MDGSSLVARATKILALIKESEVASQRKVGDVQLIAVSKGQPVEKIQQAFDAGFLCMGENYVQEWQKKAEHFSHAPIAWHFIGHLQSNKVKAVVGKVQLIHSLDRTSLAEAIGKRAEELNVVQPVLVEVNVAGEFSKSGIDPSQAPELLRAWAQIKGLRLDGIMVMPPPSEVAEDSRRYFRQASEWLKAWSKHVGQHPWSQLSMGTTQDFAVAIQEGATLVRVGSAFFGPRSSKQVKSNL